MKKSTLLFVSTFIVLFTAGLGTLFKFQPELKYELLEIYSLFAKKEEPVRQPIPSVQQEEEFDPGELVAFSGRLKKDTYEEHLTAAELKGLRLIQDEYQLYQKIHDSTLVDVSQGRGYRVDSLTHSFPFVTTDSKVVLEELGKAYEALAGEGNFFTVSSATRTESQQKALKRRNRNATDGNSSHSYGISFDISYIRFNGVRGWDGKAQKNLETVLNHFQQTGKIYVIKERRQSCYHVTVR
jgi:hypothetical protein